MKSFYFSMLMALGLLVAMPTQAQSERKMLIHMKDKTVQEVPVSSIDSIRFVEVAAPSAFKMTIDEAHPLYASFVVTPKDMNATYNMMIVEKGVFDQYQSEEEVIADDMRFFQDMADGYQTSLQDILQQMLLSGEYADYHVGLLPDTEYVMWAYGMDYDGKQTSPMTKVAFRTPAGTHVDGKIAINVTRTADEISAEYVPDNNNMYYTAGVMNEKDAFSSFFIPKKLQTAISNAIADYVLGEAPLSEYLATSASMGASTGNFQGVGTDKYFVIAAYLDDECCICSDVSVVESTPGTSKQLSSTRSFLNKTSSVKRLPSAKFQIKDQMIRLRK